MTFKQVLLLTIFAHKPKTLKPSIPKGTRDFSPAEMVKRNYIFDNIRSVYQRYGYLPIETPSMENTETLMGKYGEEGDRLIFKILDSGDFFSEIKKEVIDKGFEEYLSIKPNDLQQKTPIEVLKYAFAMAQRNAVINATESFVIANGISGKALRYDLTVPFARYVVMHRNEITFPFKRYQIQPVWRADRPQKGRYREFYQCDADVIGSNSLLNELELIQIIDEVYSKLGLSVTIKINNRKILQGVADYCGCSDRLTDITVAIDKFDKIGKDAVIQELKSKGISEDKLEIIFDCIFPTEEDYIFYTKEQLINFGYRSEDADIEIRNQEHIYRKDLGIINCLDDNFRDSDNINIGLKGVEETKYLFDTISLFQLKSAKLEFDPTLARGLNYYTGAIIEVKVNEPKSTFTGSICGGGRYDDLTGIFGLPDVSGVGISFGADRIYDVLEELKMFPDSASASTKVLVVNFGEEEENYALQITRKLREAGINTELYPDIAKLKKQFSYADAKRIPFVITAGKDEIAKGIVALKNMSSGEQYALSLAEAIEKLS